MHSIATQETTSMIVFLVLFGTLMLMTALLAGVVTMAEPNPAPIEIARHRR